MERDVVCDLGGGLWLVFANFPASAKGGGAANRTGGARGGESSRGGVGSLGALSLFPLLGAGGAGGGPLPAGTC